MSDPPFHRRQPPSPLVFSPETVLAPIPLQPQASTSSTQGSGSNTVSMPFAEGCKGDCDKELQRVTNNITAFFEDRLRDADHETERDMRDRERERDRDTDPDRRDSFHADVEPLREPFVFHPAELGSALQVEESSSDGGYEAEVEYGRHSRQPSSASQMSPASLRRQNTAPWDKPLSNALSSNTPAASSPASSTIMLPDAPITRKQPVSGAAPTSWSAGGGTSSRRLSRTIHIPARPTRSGQSSRSTSRSRSPLPPASSHTNFSEYISNPNRRSSRILVDDPVDPIMTALYDIIGVATDVIDMSVAQLTANPKVCESLVQRVQNIGKAWDEHPEWHGRNWYVQVLLAVASLSRVVEWWEAEKQFWNFDENEDEQDEPLMFVTKPAEETPHIESSHKQLEHELENFKLNDDTENQLRLARPPSHGRRSRDEQPKDLTPAPGPFKEQKHVRSALTKHMDSAESARVLATERLRLQAETAQNQNIVMELSLDGDHFIWINHAWRGVVGMDPEELAGTRISNLLSPADHGVFREASQRLQDDDSHTVEVRFHLQIEPSIERDPSAGTLYQQMEGKDGQPSHTMWVVKPIAPPRYEHDAPSITLEENDAAPEPASTIRSTFGERTDAEPMTPFPFNQPISTEPILCRICECQIPQWYFEKHSETCAETHRLEAEIMECNESVAELKNTIRDLVTSIDRASPSTAPEYRGMPIYVPSSSPIMSSPLQLFRANKMQRYGVKKMQKRLLDQLEDILQVAAEIALPSLKEEEAKEPIERQRLLSPSSERKITQVRNWCKPSTEDVALGQLVQDAERVMRQKIDNVVRMQNTIRYAEKIWLEWQERVEGFLATVEEADSESGSRTKMKQIRIMTGEASDPTPMSSLAPIPIPQITSPDMRPVQIPSHHGQISAFGSRQVLHTRSSTPSSVSSPLALAAPITRKSAQNLLEPKFVVTPPASPLVTARDGTGLTRETSIKRSHRRHSTAVSPGPLSPRQPSTNPLTRANPTSIKDFEIIKPISKGAFGSVFLAKKKVTGDYFAIKVLKKADMIAKNQITNVKAERMILMKQAESPFVAKLYFTFQSKENLYLVMEYLNGGDCAALIKSLGALPEEWTKNYIAEVVLGLEYLHQRGVVHRDLKPDNLLIDQHGHLKLTDFGLSRIGLLGRQTRQSQLIGRTNTRYSSRSRPPSMDSAYLSSPLIYTDANTGGSYFTQRTNAVPRLGSSPYLPPTDDVSESSGSESMSGLHIRRSGKQLSDSPLQSFATELTNDLRSHSNSGGGGTPPGEQKFVGTPDYLAPETILGLRGDDAAVDWWALGVITYEFLYGIPPFHAESPEKVFENILSGNVEWHEEWAEVSNEALDFMKRLLALDPNERLGAGGADEVKSHPFFAGIEWDKVTTSEAAFVPRGAVPQLFHDEDQVELSTQSGLESRSVSSSMPPPSFPVPIAGKESSQLPGNDDFGSFSFKNLPVLKQANDDVIRKLKTDQMAPLTQALSEPNYHQRKRSVSTRMKKPPSVVTSMDSKNIVTNPPSPATSTSSLASSPSRTTSLGGTHVRKPSEYGAGLDRRNSMPSRLRTASVSSAGDASGSEAWNSSGGYISQQEISTPPPQKGPDPTDRAVTCLLAEDNPITAKIIETLLIRLGCRCVVVSDGSEAISVAMGDIKFDCILMDLHMPVLDGEGAARYIKSTNSKNTNTPIIAISAYGGADPGSEASNLFTASLSKPLQKNDLLAVMRQLGFKTSTMQGAPGNTKVTASHIAPVL
ncbi:hypothetical protein BDQ17DRAFT_1389314 [Cyathus striatus]|nr:hypothetical protein BDQ17DRAFT_1389314 [Cyathus striatus]